MTGGGAQNDRGDTRSEPGMTRDGAPGTGGDSSGSRRYRNHPVQTSQLTMAEMTKTTRARTRRALRVAGILSRQKRKWSCSSIHA